MDKEKITPSLHLRQIIMGHLAKFAEELSGSLYLEAEHAAKQGENLVVDMHKASMLRYICKICDVTNALAMVSNKNDSLYHDSIWALQLLRASNDSRGSYYIAKTFVACSEIERLELAINGYIQGVDYGSA